MAKAKATLALSSSPTTPGPLCFVDGRGGAFASLAVGLVRAQGRSDALAATTSASVGVPAEIVAVLAEIGLAAPEVVLAAALPLTAECVDLSSWRLSLHEGEGDLERLALARIARDSIERRLEGDR
jgi:hypothetical protein